MIQDISPSTFHVEYPPSAPKAGDIVYLFPSPDTVLLKEDGSSFRYEEIAAVFPYARLRYLFRIDDTSFFWMDAEYPAGTEESIFSELPGHAKPRPLHDLRHLHSVPSAFAGYTASHLISWYRLNRFCGRCGTPLEDGTDERKLICPHCHNVIYPRINPAVIVAVHDGDRLLMTKYAGRKVTWFVLIAGFVEIGESAEDTVRREVLEETGVHVKNIRYFGSQPWGIPGNLTLGYTAELEGSDEITVEQDELSEARWFDRENIPVRRDDNLSITSAMIRAFADGQF